LKSETPSPSELFAKSLTRPFVILGPCVLESLELALETAAGILEATLDLDLTVVFKSSFDKANRTSVNSYRGPGLSKGVEWLGRIGQETGLPVITDIHERSQAKPVAEVAQALQIPAFLCRQTDIITAAAETDRIVNIKKGQFLAPWDMKQPLDKALSTGNNKVWLTERGSSFGYNNLVVDFRSLGIMGRFGAPVVFDATHSVQLPGGLGGASGGQREFVPGLARAAAAYGCHGIFMEVHPQPERALCDGPNSWPLKHLRALLQDLNEIWKRHHGSCATRPQY